MPSQPRAVSRRKRKRKSISRPSKRARQPKLSLEAQLFAPWAASWGGLRPSSGPGGGYLGLSGWMPSNRLSSPTSTPSSPTTGPSNPTVPRPADPPRPPVLLPPAVPSAPPRTPTPGKGRQDLR